MLVLRMRSLHGGVLAPYCTDRLEGHSQPAALFDRKTVRHKVVLAVALSPLVQVLTVQEVALKGQERIQMYLLLAMLPPLAGRCFFS